MSGYNSSKLSTKLTFSEEILWFTLMDYLNNKYLSKSVDEILTFYEAFPNRDQLFNWMRDRPKINPRLYIRDGIRDVVVVIPTTDFTGSFSQNCLNDIFKGLQIVLVGGEGTGNNYFNFARSMNAGIEKALSFNPRWIVYSNDDMFKIDPVENLLSELKKLDNKTYSGLFVKNQRVSPVSRIGTTWTFTYIWNLVNHYHFKHHKKLKKLIRDFEIKYSFVQGYARYFYKHILTYTNTGSFCVFSSDFVKSNMPLYDETFVNSADDIGVSLKIALSKKKTKLLENYNIGNVGGATLMNGPVRELRSVCNRAYLDYLWKNS